MHAILERIRAVAAPGAIVEAYGSSVYAPQHAADVDVLVSHDDPARLAAALGFALLPTTPPRLEGEIDGMPVDITIANGDGELAQRMRAGPRDAAMLVERLDAAGHTAAFHATWPQVRGWVKTRALGRNGLGYFGSFGWALALATSLIDDAARDAGIDGLGAWLRWLAARAPIVGRLVLVAPAPPYRDVANLSRRGTAVVLGEAQRASRIDIADDAPPGTALAITGTDERGRGRYEGIARGLLRELEPLGAIRSWGRFDVGDDDTWQHRISIPTPRVRNARTIIDHWLATSNIDAVIE